MEQSNIISFEEYKKNRKRLLSSFSYRVTFDPTGYKDALQLIIISTLLSIISFSILILFLHYLLK